MDLPLNAYPKIGNKVLIALSGLNRDSSQDDGGRKYDRHQYQIADRFLSFNWSKSLIKQLLVYVASCNSEGDISVISESAMAKEMDVSVRTIQHNNYLLAKAGILEWERVFTDMITVSFTHYQYDILGLEAQTDENPNKNRSTGFTYLEKETISELLKESDVNALRTAMRFFALTETQFNGSSQATEIHVFYKDLTNFLPEYVGYKSKIKDICNKVKRFLPIQVVEGKNALVDFLRNHRLNKQIVRKAKDTLLYVVKKDDTTPARHKRFQDTYRFLALFKDFQQTGRRKDILINKDLKLNREDVESLVSSFGLSILKGTLERLRDLLEKQRVYPLETTEEEMFYINTFYQEPSKGLRFLASV